MKKSLWVFAFFLCCFCSHQVKAQQNDEAAIRKTVAQLYQLLSFTDTNAIVIDKIVPLFTADAKLIANFGPQLLKWSVSEYIASVRLNIQTQNIYTMSEKELTSRIDVFGKVAHAFSTYEFSTTGKERSFTRRGINSIQLLKLNEKWQIVSLIWDREGENLKIPSQYLGN